VAFLFVAAGLIFCDSVSADVPVPKEWISQILSVCRGRNAKDGVYILQSSPAYTSMTLNNVAALERQGIDTYVVFAYGASTAHILRQEGVRPHHIIGHDAGKVNRRYFWGHRHIVALEILRAGVPVTLLDSDAVVLADPRETILQYPSFDIVASRGSHPPRFGKKYGASLCMGFIHMRPTAAVVDFYVRHNYLGWTKKDDQEEFNMALARDNILFDEGRLIYADSTTAAHGHTSPTSGMPLSLILLPNSSFRRICINNEPCGRDSSWPCDGVVILHCYMSGQDRAAALARAGDPWFLS